MDISEINEMINLLNTTFIKLTSDINQVIYLNSQTLYQPTKMSFSGSTTESNRTTTLLADDSITVTEVKPSSSIFRFTTDKANTEQSMF